MAAGVEKDKPWFLDDSQVIGFRNCVIFLGFQQGSKIQGFEARGEGCRGIKGTNRKASHEK